MSKPHSHFSRLLALAPLAVAIGFCAGCWEEVHYTGTTAPVKRKDEPRAEAPIPSSGPGIEAESFGDELARALAELSRQQAPVPTTPAAEFLPDFLPPTGTRRGEPPESAVVSTPRRETAGDAGAARPLFPTTPPTTIESTQAMPPVTSKSNETGTTLFPEVSPPNPTTSGAAPRTGAAPVETERTRTRRAAWLLGSRWSLAALARERGADEKGVAEWVTVAQTQAASLGTTLNEMPPVSAAGAPKTTPSPTVAYLIADGQRLGRELAAKQGADHAALLELAVKTNLLLVLYEPSSPTTVTLADVIAQARRQAVLPVEVTQPLLSLMAERRPAGEVRQAVFRLHDEMDRQMDSTLMR